MKLKGTVCALALLASLLPSTAWAERVSVRAGARGDGARVVFDWPEAVTHTARLSDNRVVVMFDRPIEADAASLSQHLPSWISSARLFSSGKGLFFILKRPAQLRSFSSGHLVVLDLSPLAVKPPEVVAAPHVPENKPEHKPEKPSAPPQPPEPPKPSTPPAPSAPPEPASPPQPPVPPAPTPVAVIEPTAKPAPVLDKPVAVVSPPVTPSPIVSSVVVADSLPSAEIHLPPASPLAVFRRGTSLFLVVTDKDTPSDLVGLVGATLAGHPAVKLLSGQGGRVVRIDVAALNKHEPFVEALPTGGWRVRFDGTQPQPITALPVEVQSDYALGARVLVRTDSASKPVSFIDPVVGDTLTVVPVSALATGVSLGQHVVQADVLPTVQGIAVSVRADGVGVLTSTMGVEVNANGGLKLAEHLAVSETTVAADDAKLPNLPPLFDFSTLGQPAGDAFIQQRQDLQAALAAAKKEERDAARLALARFYFINGMPTEAAALWSIIAHNQPDMAERPDYKLIKAIAAFSSGTLSEVKAELAGVNLPNLDSALWAGMLAVRERDWKTASEQFRMALGRIKDYPEPYITRLQIAAVEMALNTDDQALAESLLKSMTDRQRALQHGASPAADYLTGVLDWQLNKSDEARAKLGSAAQSWEQLWRVRSELALIEADIKEGKATPEDALKRLERLRYAWRGDALEFDMLHRLADLHIQIGDYAAAFENYARLAEKFPNDPRTAALPEEQRAAFTRIFQGEDRDKTPAFIQLAIWDRYPDFRPTQADVLDDVRLYLGNRVAGIDLLDRAAGFYGDVLAHITSPVAKAEMGAKIAGLRLLDNHSEDALKVLQDTAAAQQPSPLSESLRDERRILQARALFGMNKPEDALALMVTDYSDPAMRLRADITWRTRKWAEAAAAFDALIGAPPAADTPLDAATSALVVNRATALTLAGDNRALAELRSKFSAVMDKTPEATTFQILTRPESAGGLADRTAVLQRVAEVDLFQKFLEHYRSPPTP